MADEQKSLGPESPESFQPLPIQEPPEKTRVKEALARVPSVSEGEWRIACSDVAEALSHHSVFKLKVMWPIGITLISVLGIITAFFGFSTKNEIKTELEGVKTIAVQQIGTAQAAIAAQITKEFREEKIQATIAKAASDQSAILLSESVQPSIDKFNQRVEERLGNFDASLMAQREAATRDMESLRTELTRLKARNEIVALGDRAIAQASVDAYRKAVFALKVDARIKT